MTLFNCTGASTESREICVCGLVTGMLIINKIFSNHGVVTIQLTLRRSGSARRSGGGWAVVGDAVAYGWNGGISI